MNIIYEDANIICLNKENGIPVQPDKTQDISLLDEVENYLNVKPFIINRIDRPVSGLVIFAKTKEAARKFTATINSNDTIKTYYAVIEKKCKEEHTVVENYLYKKNNKAYITNNKTIGKKAILHFQFSGKSKRYFYYKIKLLTGRFHQIRAQLSAIGCYIKGDVKYGAKRSNKDRSIDLHAYSISFLDPFSKKKIILKAEFPDKSIWKDIIIY